MVKNDQKYQFDFVNCVSVNAETEDKIIPTFFFLKKQINV